jgi:hypothetical protein
MQDPSQIASNRPLAGIAVYVGDLHLGFVIQRPRGFEAVTLRGDMGRFATPAAAARALIALAAPTSGEHE